MVYNKTKWQDEIPDLTKPILGPDGKQKIDSQTGRPLFELVQTGTRITSAKLNNIEDGIDAAHTLTEQLAAEVNGNFVASGMVFTFADLTASWTAGIAYVSGRRFDIAAGSLTLTAKQGQYIYMNVSGVIQKTTTESIARAALLLWYFATDASKAITSTDMRRIITSDSYAFKSETVAKENGKGLSTNNYTDADKARVQSHEDKLTDLVPRLNTPTTTQLILEPGTQTVQVARDMPFNLSGISGRVLLNLLGRAGTFDTMSGWSLTGGSGVIDQAYPLYGANALRFTLSGASGRISRSVTTVSGKRYLAAVDVRIGTATNAYLYVGGVSNGGPVSSTTGYVITYLPFTANSATVDIGVIVNGTNGQTAYVDGFRLYELPSADYSLISNVTAVEVAVRWPYTEGLAGVRNPYVIRWTSSAKKSVAAMLAIDTELLAPPVPTDDAERDRLDVGADGQYYKQTQWRKVQLSGDLDWKNHVSFTGYKSVRLVVSNAATSGNIPYATKYDKTVLRLGDPSGAGSGDAVLLDNTGNLYITLSAADTGWGDNYNPSEADVKAYFYGWKMFDASLNGGNGTAPYNNTGEANKQWTPLDSFDGTIYNGTVSTVPTATVANSAPIRNYAKKRDIGSYELMYKRATTIVEAIASEGIMSLVQGDNTIEVGSGLVIREAARPQSSGLSFWINGAITPSILRNRVRNFLQIYRDGRPDQWTYLPTTNFVDQLGLQQAQISMDRYDFNATYSVSYLPIEYYATTSFAGLTLSNERAILDDLLKDVQQTIRRVSVIENKKIDKDVGVNWIVPTLLNGWVRYSDSTAPPGYYKDQQGRVYLKGLLKGGATGANVSLFLLPSGYRPTTQFNSVALNNGTGVQFVIYNDGTVSIYANGNGLVSLDNISFLTTQ